MSKFKVGDRAIVYYYDSTTKGTIIQINNDTVLLRDDAGQDTGWFYYKQCRKLVKKERKRIWILNGPLEAKFNTLEPKYQKPNDLRYYTEFVEVRKKKK